jgi:hypothetical protein
LCREVPFEQDCIEQLSKILYSNSGHFFKDFAGDEVVPWWFSEIWAVDDFLNLISFEAFDCWFELVRGFQELDNVFSCFFLSFFFFFRGIF